jgi:alpha-beta hydrolase superfamily lysophospholipase
MKRTGTAKAYETWNKDMPVMLLYGGSDPVGDDGKGVVRIYNQMKKAGMQQVELWGIPDARHDIFHEEASGTAELVRCEICDWLEK